MTTRLYRVSRTLAAIMVTVLVAGSASACSRAHQYKVGSGGGTVGEAKLAQVRVPAGALSSDATFHITESKDHTDNGLSAVAAALGQPVDISVDKVPSSAEVMLPVDLEHDLITVDGKKAATGNLFIGVYNDVFKTWVPLPTRYDAATHMLIAAAPHFSTFRRYVVNPLKSLGSTIVDGVTALAEQAAETWDAATHLASPEQREAECGDADAHYRVTSTLDQVHGCLADDTVRVQNGLLIPVDVTPQTAGIGVGPHADDAQEDSLPLLIARALSATRGASLLAGRGRTRLDVPAASLKLPAWRSTVQPDLTAIALDGVLTSLSWLPPAREYETVVLQSRAELTTFIAEGKTIQEFFAQIEVEIRQEKVAAPEVLHFADTVSEALECVNASRKVIGAGVPELRSAVVELVKSCVSQALERLGEQVKKSVKDIVGIATAVPDSVRFLHELAQMIGLGVSDVWRNGGIFQLDVIAAAQPSRLDAVDWATVAGGLLHCHTEPEVFFKPTQHDITGDGTPDTFVFADCYTGDGRYPDTLTVWDGTSDPQSPTRLGTLESDLYYTGGCLTFAGDAVTLHAHDYADTDPNAAPSLAVTQTYTWNGSEFTAGTRTTTKAPPNAGKLPGC